MDKLSKKIGVVVVSTIVCTLMSGIISWITSDRETLSHETQKEVSKTWSGEQNIIGPVICVPLFSEKQVGANSCMYVLPETLDLTADMKCEKLHRGIFDAMVYRSTLTGEGRFNLSDISRLRNDTSSTRMDWSRAQLIMAIGDKRGIEEGIALTVNGKSYDLSHRFNNYENQSLSSVFSNSYETICCMIDLSEEVGKTSVPFTVSTCLKGSESISLAPVGESSTLTIQGDCEDPSFHGFVLPTSREVNEDGFKATWKILSLNRYDVERVFCASEPKNFQMVSTRLMQLGGQYTKIWRVIRYSFLVILLSLLAVFVAELSVKRYLNILNYVLLSAALVLFYLILLAFSEWIGFAWSYLVSVIMVISMVVLYLIGIVKDKKVAMAVGLFLTLVDCFIFILLGLENMSLLIGTLALFVLLGAVMFLSLRFNVKDTEAKDENKLRITIEDEK